MTTIPAIPGQLHGSAATREGFSFLKTAAELAQFGLDLIAFQPRQLSRRGAATRTRAQKLIEANEHMCRHIARELHDDIGQRLSLLSIRLGVLQQSQTIEDPGGNLAGSLRDLDTLISDVHRLSHSLHSSRIEHLGLHAALRELFERLQECFGTHIEFMARDIPENLQPGIALCFFRIAQESLNNVIKHSHSSRAQIELKADHVSLMMRVRDFGAGFDREQMPEGIGLMTMEERMAAIGGTLTVESKPGAGTIVTAVVELYPQALPV